MTQNIRLKVYKAGSRWTFDLVKKSRSHTWTYTTWPVVWEGIYYDSWKEAFKEGIKIYTAYVEGYEIGNRLGL